MVTTGAILSGELRRVRMDIEWAAIIALCAVISAAVAIGALAFAIRNQRKQAERLSTQTEALSHQAELLRKQLFGEVYDEARVNGLQFLLPAKHQREVEGFRQKDEHEISLNGYVAIPVGVERELHICWEMAESQTLRGYRLRFEGDYRRKPQILGMESSFAKRVFQASAAEEYIDWNGDFHREYVRELRCPKGSYHYVAIRVKGNTKGKYSLRVRVRVDEAPKPFEENLTVECLDSPSGWAKRYWC